MKVNTLKETMESDGYSRESQYFYELAQKLKEQIMKEELVKKQDEEISPPSKIENNRKSSIYYKKRLDQDET